MKHTIIRTSLVIAAFGIGIALFLILLLAGDKSRGPLGDIASFLGVKVAKLEQQMLLKKTRKSRTKDLLWFDAYRQDAAKINQPDTFFLGVYDNHTSSSFQAVVELEDSLNFKLPIIHLYTAWGSKGEQVFPLLKAQTIYSLGSIPLITWEPWLNDFDVKEFPTPDRLPDPNKGGLKAIANGEYNAYLDKWAKDAKKLEGRFFLRLGHEMNDPYRYPWGPHNNLPEDYVAAWRHVVDFFRAAGTHNVSWVWSPHPAYAPYDIFYPGDEYVDWLGVTTLNYGTIAPWSQWWAFHEIFAKCYNSLAAYNKPIVITEFSSLSVGGDRAAWFEEALSAMPETYPAVKALVFFHNSADATTTYKALDWSFKNDEASLQSIKRSIGGW
jgi:hypothetical protein